MVEQENSQASLSFPDSEKSNIQDCLAWVDDIASLGNEEDLYNFASSTDVTEKMMNYSHDALVKEEILDDSYLCEPDAQISNDLSIEAKSETSRISSISDQYFETSSPLSFWGSCPLDLDTMKLDDVFQVDKDDLFLSPTLAELNANDESLLDSFDCFHDILPSNGKNLNNKLAQITNSDQGTASKTSGLENENEFPIKEDASFTIKPYSKAKVVECLGRINETFPWNDKKLQTVPASVNDVKFHNKSSESSKCFKDNMNAKTTDIKPVAVEKSESDDELPHSSNKIYDSDEDSDMDGDYTSDADEDSDDEVKPLSHKQILAKRFGSKKKNRFFWQYNMQSKGPKGPKMKLTGKFNNAHDVPGVADPVFQVDCSVIGVKHSGKARKGDGNDLTPNPRKLRNIGLELEKLNYVIDGLVPVNELPLNARSKSRKEKNKLASRACRLKKKAQHEANKLKLFGLQQEQRLLLVLINETKKLLRNKICNFKQVKDYSVSNAMEALKKRKSITRVAGCSADYVNNVLKAVTTGNDSGKLAVPNFQQN